MTPQELEILQNMTLPLILVVLWTLPWKGVALWKAAQNKQKVWFVVLLIVNTLAILDIIYIFIFSKKKNKKQDIIHQTLNF